MARCLILPSIFEPWSVVIHEACAAGIPIIATYPCGATVMFVRDGINGYIIPPDSEAVLKAMRLFSEINDEDLAAKGEASVRLAKFWSPQLLAKYFFSNVKRRKRNRNFFPLEE